MRRVVSLVLVLLMLATPAGAIPKMPAGSAFYGLKLGVGNFIFKYMNKEVVFKFGFETRTTNVWQALKIPKSTRCIYCNKPVPTTMAAFTMGACADCFIDKHKLNGDALIQFQVAQAIAERAVKETKKPKRTFGAHATGAEEMWIHDRETKTLEIFVLHASKVSDRQRILEAFSAYPEWGSPSDYEIYVQHGDKLPVLHVLPAPGTTAQSLAELVANAANAGYEISQLVLHCDATMWPKVLVGVGVIGGLDLLRRVLQLCIGLPPI